MSLRLIAKNIHHVERLEQDGITYEWGVVMKHHPGIDVRDYINYENGKTVAKEYPKEWLPKEVIKFIDSHQERIVDENYWGGHHYTIYQVQ